MNTIRWSYAINQYKPQFDDFVRREDHERALKTMSIAGFEGVELTTGQRAMGTAGQPDPVDRELRLAHADSAPSSTTARSVPSPVGSSTPTSG